MDRKQVLGKERVRGMAGRAAWRKPRAAHTPHNS
jgi:hypothetical protein